MAQFEIYQDKRKKWRWRLTARNGLIVADSGQGYVRKRNVLRAIHRLSEIMDVANIKEGK